MQLPVFPPLLKRGAVLSQKLEMLFWKNMEVGERQAQSIKSGGGRSDGLE